MSDSAHPDTNAQAASPSQAVENATLTMDERFAEAEQLVARELAARGEQAVLTNSFQAEDMVLLAMARRTHPEIPVVFLDTGYHFAELIAYRDEMAAAWGMNLINVLPEQTVAEQESAFGILYQSDASSCCRMRKVEPLFRSLAGYQLWLTGLRREQAKSRATLSQIEDFRLPGDQLIRKVSPLSEWSTRDVWFYAERHAIPLVSLYDKGYSSIGCQPCTSLPLDPNDPRSGRWGGQKLECGIHIQAS